MSKKGTDAYLVRVGDVQVGPVTLDQLQRGLKAGKIPRHAEAKSIEAVEWKPVSEVAVPILIPPPRPPRRKGPEPSWSAFQGGQVVSPAGAPPLPSRHTATDESVGVPTKTFSRPMYMVFVPGSVEPPAGPFRASALRARLDSGVTPSNALVCLVDEQAQWLPIADVFDE